jgi:hypothetical protein
LSAGKKFHPRVALRLKALRVSLRLSGKREQTEFEGIADPREFNVRLRILRQSLRIESVVALLGNTVVTRCPQFFLTAPRMRNLSSIST